LEDRWWEGYLASTSSESLHDVQEVKSQLKAEMLEWNCDQNLCKILQRMLLPQISQRYKALKVLLCEGKRGSFCVELEEDVWKRGSGWLELEIESEPDSLFIGRGEF
jgi:hypothetical protein